MSGRAKKNIVLFSVGAYCAVSWVAMRLDYLAMGGEVSAKRQFVHLAFTVAILLLLTLWKGHAIESFNKRLTALPLRWRIAPFVVAAVLVFTMLNYPRNRISFHMLTWGLMESTRALVEGLFLAGATFSVVWAILLNARPVAEAFLRLAERLIFRSPRRAFLVGAMLLVFLETNAISLFQFHHVPICSDEVNYIFQSKIFASGHLYAQPPQDPQFFSFVSFVIGDKWYSIVNPGYPLLLTLGVFVGAPWIVNPALAALCVMLVYLAAGLMYDERIARGSAALMVVSPFFLMLSSFQLSHTTTAFFFLLFLYFFLKGLGGGRWFHFLLAGLALGAMALTRPLTAAAVSIPWAAYTLWLVFKRRIHPVNAGVLAFGVAVGVALLLSYNSVLTGDPFTSGYNVFYGKNFRLGFVQPPRQLVYAKHRHTPLRGVVNLNNGFFYLNKYLFGWPLPSLLFAMIPFALPSRNKWDYLMLASFLSIPAVYFFFFHQDFMMGPRYYFSVIPAAVILSARGLRDTPELWSRLAGPKGGIEAVSRFLAVLIFACIVFNLALFLPDRLRYYEISSPIHQGVPAPIWRHLESEKVHNAVVFINDFPYSLAYGTGLWRNDPALKGDIVFARDQGLGNDVLMQRYPGRRYYRYWPAFESFTEIFPSDESAGEPAPSSQ